MQRTLSGNTAVRCAVHELVRRGTKRQFAASAPMSAFPISFRDSNVWPVLPPELDLNARFLYLFAASHIRGYRTHEQARLDMVQSVW